MTKNQDNNQHSDIDVDHLRQVVLKWVEKKQEQTQPAKSSPKKNGILKNHHITPPIIDEPKILPSKLPTADAKISTRVPMDKKRHLATRLKISGGLLTIVLLTFIGFGAWLNSAKPTNQTVATITSILPYPVAMVGTTTLRYSDWLAQFNSLRQFYKQESAANPGLEIPNQGDTQKHIFERMIDRVLIGQLAKKYNVSISREELDQQLGGLVKEIGSRQGLEQQLQNLYSWDISQFEDEILSPLLLRNKVALAVTFDDRLNQEVRLQAENLLEQLRGGTPFAALASQYSQDVTALQGGDLGYFGRGQMVKEFEEAAFALEPGDISEIIKTQFGYHIIMVEERLANDDGEVVQVRARHILLRGKSLEAELEALKAKTLIIKFLKI